MKFILRVSIVFFIVSTMLLVASIWAMFTKSIAWIVFAIPAGCMAYFSRNDWVEIKNRIFNNIAVASHKILSDASGRNPGDYTVEYIYNDNYYEIEYTYILDGEIELGAEHNGEWEKVFRTINEQIIVRNIYCTSCTTGEAVDCGFTTKDLQDLL
jgi:NMD protein affecting ribosome stability and mRNA decay